MDQILTEQDLAVKWDEISPHRWCLIASRARALLAHRYLMIKERDDAVLKAQHAVNAEMKANEALIEIRHALGGFAGPTYGIAERVKTVVADRDFYAKQASEADDTIKRVVAERDTLAARAKELEDFIGSSLVVSSVNMREDFNTARRVTVEFVFGPESKRDMMTLVLKDNGARPVKPFAATTTSTAVNPAKPGLQPMKCVCCGQITLRDARVGTCQKCGASCRVMDPPPTVPSCQPEGHMIHIPAEYCGDSSWMHAYADGYLAGKGAK